MSTTEHPIYGVTERVAELLAEHGVPATYEPFGPLIYVEDDGAFWAWGTVNETWGADLMRDPSIGDMIGCAATDVSSESTDPALIAAAILAALNGGVGVELYPVESGS